MKMLFITVCLTLLTFTAESQAQTRPAARKTVQPAYQQPISTVPASWSYGIGFKHEIDLNLSEGYFKTYSVGGKNISDLKVFGSYSFDLGNNFQVGGDAGLQSVDSTTKLTAVGTGTYNMDTYYSDAIFFKAGLGLFPVTKVSTGKIEEKNDFGLFVGAGKRFKLWDHVNYKPGIYIAKISDFETQFTVHFLNISLNFN